MLSLDFFDNGSFFEYLGKCRSTLAEALSIAADRRITPPVIATALAHNLDYLVLQAHRVISWRAEAEQLARAKAAESSQNYAAYHLRLLELYAQSDAEVFSASRRVVDRLQSLLTDSDSAEQTFLPGYAYSPGRIIRGRG